MKPKGEKKKTKDEWFEVWLPKFLPTMQCQVGPYFWSNIFFICSATSFSTLNFSNACKKITKCKSKLKIKSITKLNYLKNVKGPHYFSFFILFFLWRRGEREREITATAMSTASFWMSSFMSALFMITFLPGFEPEEDFRSSEDISGTSAPPPPLLFISSLIFSWNLDSLFSDIDKYLIFFLKNESPAREREREVCGIVICKGDSFCADGGSWNFPAFSQ